MPPALDSLGVEQEIIDHAIPQNGLVLITGVMGSGKSTLLAAILRKIIETGGRHVATYEAPIEFDLDAVPNPGCPVSQSAIPEHLKSFLTATRNSSCRESHALSWPLWTWGAYVGIHAQNNN